MPKTRTSPRVSAAKKSSTARNLHSSESSSNEAPSKKLMRRTPTKAKLTPSTPRVLRPENRKGVLTQSAQKQGFSLYSISIGIQVFIIMGAVAAFLGLGFIDIGSFRTSPSRAEQTAFGISAVPITFEHERAASLSLLIAKKENRGYSRIHNVSDETVKVRLPSSWSRVEVSGTSLQAVTSSVSFFGTTVWSLPPRVSAAFDVPLVPQSITFIDASRKTTLLELSAINVIDNTSSRQSLLIKEESTVRLWDHDGR